MYELYAETRDSNVKVNQIRKKGLIPCSINMGKGGATRLVTVEANIAKQMIRTLFKGSVLTLRTKAENYKVLLQDINYNGLEGQIQDLVFQRLVEGQYVTSTARIVLPDKEKVSATIQLFQSDIPYRSLPNHIVESIEINVGRLKRGDKIMVRDLTISTNPDIEVLLPLDRMVLCATA